MNEVYFDIPVKIISLLDQRIADAFSVYDHRAVNMVDERDVGAIIRSLGCAPTEIEIQEIIKKTEFSTHPGDVHLLNFMPHVKVLLAAKKLKPSPPEEILKAFKILDPEDKGFIEKETFINMLVSFGEPMTEKEMRDFIKSAVILNDDRIDYEQYIKKLIYEPEECIYKLAD